MCDVTQILSQMEQGDPNAAELLLPVVYVELRKLAAARLRQEEPGQTLQATALVHEAYLRLVDQTAAPPWDNRGHFFAAAAEAMRRILIDRARARRRPKHGGDHAASFVGWSHFVKGLAYRGLRDFDEAANHARANVEVVRDLPLNQHRYAEWNAERVLTACDRYDEIESIVREGIQWRREELGEDHIEVKFRRAELAKHLIELNAVDRVGNELIAAMTELIELPCVPSARKIEYANNLTAIYTARGEANEVTKWQQMSNSLDSATDAEEEDAGGGSNNEKAHDLPAAPVEGKRATHD